MGYASTFEAINEKLADLAHLAEQAVREAPGATSTREQGMAYAKLLAQAQDAINQLAGWLELATNPEVDLGRELNAARDAQRELSARIASYERTCIALAASLNRERSASNALAAKLEVQVRTTKRLEEALADKLRTKPASVYEA